MINSGTATGDLSLEKVLTGFVYDFDGTGASAVAKEPMTAVVDYPKEGVVKVTRANGVVLYYAITAVSHTTAPQ